MLRRLPATLIAEMVEFSQLFEQLDRLVVESRDASHDRQREIELEIDRIEDRLLVAEHQHDDPGVMLARRRRTG